MSPENSNQEAGNQASDNQDLENNPVKTPLEAVREQQAMQQKNREVAEQREEPSPEVPGASHPSTIRHHPQRQMYGQGTTES